MREGENVRSGTGRVVRRANKVDLFLSQPEILRWLELNEQEVVAWLSPQAREDEAETSRSVREQASMTATPARLLTPKHGLTVIAKPLRHGDVRTVMSIFDGMGERSRRFRFNGPKPCLTRSELRQLATVDVKRQALVAYLEEGSRPVGIARLARADSGPEIAFAVVDKHQRRGIGSVLVSELFVQARAAGITEVTALMSGNNTAALALLRHVARALTIRHEGSDLSIRAAIA